jgi:hypothetical protein
MKTSVCRFMYSATSSMIVPRIAQLVERWTVVATRESIGRWFKSAFSENLLPPARRGGQLRRCPWSTRRPMGTTALFSFAAAAHLPPRRRRCLESECDMEWGRVLIHPSSPRGLSSSRDPDASSRVHPRSRGGFTRFGEVRPILAFVMSSERRRALSFRLAEGGTNVGACSGATRDARSGATEAPSSGLRSARLLRARCAHSASGRRVSLVPRLLRCPEVAAGWWVGIEFNLSEWPGCGEREGGMGEGEDVGAERRGQGPSGVRGIA